MNARNKKIGTYLLVALGGLLLGWLLFGGRSSEPEHEHTEEVAGATEYTCSMHPQIRQDGPGKCPLCGMDLIPVRNGGSNDKTNPYVLEMTPEAIALSNIQTTKMETVNPENELSLSGRVALNEQQVSSITAKFPGRIERLYVNFTGQEVRRGERLASLYSPELITAQRELQEAARAKSLMPELYEAARSKLKLWKLTDAQIRRIENAKDIITQFDIYADAAGVVTERLVNTGDYVATGTALFEVANLSSVWVVLDAYEADLAWIKQGGNITFTVPGIPGKEFTAKVAFITPVLDPTTRAIEVRAEVQNPGNQLKPGMFADARIRTSTGAKEKSLSVPSSAVLWTGKRSVVYVKVDGQDMPAFEMREVTLGPRMGDRYVIASGLQDGEEVVTNGVFAVDGAAQLRGNYSMMSMPPAGGPKAPETFQKQLTEVINQYYALKNALVASDVPKARQAAGTFALKLGEVDMGALDGKLHDQWMALLPTLKSNAEAIQKSRDLEKQRAAFSPLSDHVIEAVKVFGIQQEVAYIQSCPMALGDKGAYWLSELEDIQNPYFGQAMLTCGETEETYRRGQRTGAADAATPARAPQGHQH
ncbi:efflux RND transporter periplasmic adaptor subunit [Pontibacter sp. JH31]|uniref:Efflux RND transporter periplasmic adaptor subunit n=1 Tax=Pontibacter aquaedesilientis TaxID=2766980 RepID=A0ABR7XDQ8_9BACT|nr:efflux RND transporter periplasmic adaptor subunit [Pontibacter aquaedesilientis]MBD1396427.1 efflux RND transporter periplasmic adaptor subunit [Pontibacter aquaedesilientis]